VDALIDKQSEEIDREKRRQIVWAIERKLAEDPARPIIFYDRTATCRQPKVKGFVPHKNSIYNNWRFEDVWLE
jgi:peptide/nickel transport system substrate-binding protein